MNTVIQLPSGLVLMELAVNQSSRKLWSSFDPTSARCSGTAVRTGSCLQGIHDLVAQQAVVCIDGSRDEDWSRELHDITCLSYPLMTQEEISFYMERYWWVSGVGNQLRQSPHLKCIQSSQEICSASPRDRSTAASHSWGNYSPDQDFGTCGRAWQGLVMVEGHLRLVSWRCSYHLSVSIH